MRKKSESETVNNTLTQQTKLINELKEENYRLKNMLKKIPGSVYYKDDKGVYLNCNDFVLKMANLKSYSEIINKTDFDMPWREYADEIHRTDQKVIDSEEPLELEEYPLVNGKKISILTRKTPDFDKNGKAIGVIGVSLDITELKKTQSKLEIALKKAEVANQAKTEFIENMRHDIRTPLAGIVGCAQIIQSEEKKSKKTVGFANDLVQSSEALLAFLNKILESITTASGKILLLKKKFSLRAALEQIIQLNQSQAAVKNLGLSLAYDEAIPAYLIGDPIRIQRILLELVTNALKFTDQGEIKVSARFMKDEIYPNRVLIRLRVCDTGIGIPRDQQNEVYTRFKRFTPSYQGIYPGTGLGLSLVKQFLEELGGEIYLKSQLNQGTTFTCFIPFQEPLLQDAFGVEMLTVTDADKTKITPSSCHTDSLSTNGTEGKPRILVVEDQAISANIARKLLSDLSCQVDIARDSASALERLQQANYDLILMDIGLPDSDGATLTRRIRLDPQKCHATLPIIGLTAHIDIENKQRCLAAGMKAVFIKPLKEDLASYLLEVFVSPHRSFSSNPSRLPVSVKIEVAPVLDVAHATQLLGGEKAVQEAFSLLIRGLDEDLAELNQQRPASDWPTIKALAHKWRGGALYCGARRLEQICTQVEDCLSIEPSTKRQALYQQLIQVMEATHAAAITYQAK